MLLLFSFIILVNEDYPNRLSVTFLPRDATLQRGYATVDCLSFCLSVCLSVHLSIRPLSVTLRYPDHKGWNTTRDREKTLQATKRIVIRVYVVVHKVKLHFVRLKSDSICAISCRLVVDLPYSKSATNRHVVDLLYG